MGLLPLKNPLFLYRTLQEVGVSIKDIVHERAWLKNDIFSVEVLTILEILDSKFGNKIAE